jgi:hypothetical protein
MLGLALREEFRGKRLKGTAIELSNETNTGATKIAAKEFLEITYPTIRCIMHLAVQKRFATLQSSSWPKCGSRPSGCADESPERSPVSR